jgi:hypothetical protein
MPRKKRVYKKGAKGSEYDAYHGKPEQKKRRAQRNTARRKATKAGRVKKGDGKEVHHVGAKRTGKLPSKTRVVSRRTNRKIQPKRKR